MAPAMARADGMRRRELIFLNSSSADGCSVFVEANFVPVRCCGPRALGARIASNGLRRGVSTRIGVIERSVGGRGHSCVRIHLRRGRFRIADLIRGCDHRVSSVREHSFAGSKCGFYRPQRRPVPALCAHPTDLNFIHDENFCTGPKFDWSAIPMQVISLSCRFCRGVSRCPSRARRSRPTGRQNSSCGRTRAGATCRPWQR